MNRLREYLNAVLNVNELPQQETEMNASPAAGLPEELPRRGVKVAIDFHDEPFYGKTPEARRYMCNHCAKDGTTHLLRIASASVIWRGLRPVLVNLWATLRWRLFRRAGCKPRTVMA